MLKRRNVWMLPAAIGASLMLMVIGAVLANGVPKVFSDETASATPSLGFASTVIARDTFVQNYTFGTPTVVTVKRKVRIKTKSGFATRTVKINVDSVQRAITCNPTNPCDTAFQQATVYVLPRGTPNTGIKIDQPQPAACPSIN